MEPKEDCGTYRIHTIVTKGMVTVSAGTGWREGMAKAFEPRI